MTLKSEATYPPRRTRRLEVRSEAGLEAFADPIETPVSEQQSSFTARKVPLDSIARNLKGSGYPRPVDPTETEIALYHALGKLPEPQPAHRFY